MAYQGNLLSKTLVIGILILLIGAIITPSISGNVSEMNDIKSVKTRDINNAIQTKEKNPHTTFTTDWWTMFRHDLLHTGNSTSPAPNTNNIRWSWGTAADVTSSPAVVDGKVYVIDQNGVFYCFHYNTGDLFWVKNFYAATVYSSPAVYQGKVYVGSNTNKLHCLDAVNGSFIWDYSIGQVISSPAISEGKLYIGSYSNNKVYCLDAENGDFIWNYTTGNRIWSSPAVYEGKVFIGSWDAKVYCLDAYGNDDGTTTLIWTYTTGNRIFSSPAVVNEKVYIGSEDTKMYCLDADTGSEIWNSTVGDWVHSSPAVANGKIYIGSLSDSNKLYCLDAFNGNIIWSYSTGSGIGSSPAVADGKVYVGSDDIYCFKAETGDLLWKYNSAWSGSSPAVTEGKVYIGTENGILCFGAPPPTRPEIYGPTTGKIGNPYTYTFTSTDPEGNDISYYIKWGDGTTTNWTAFQASGLPGYNESHTWDKQGTYTIKAKAQGIYGAESNWSEFKVEIPRKRISVNSLFYWFLDRFPLLEKLLSLIRAV